MSSLQIRRIRTMALETYKILNKIAPVCLHDLIKVKNSKYVFRYSNIADVPQVRTTRYGKKSFMFAAATLWKDLPNHFRTENSFDHFKSLIQSWNGSVCRCSACRQHIQLSVLFLVFFQVLMLLSYFMFV